MAKSFLVTQVRSLAGCTQSQRATLRALGLTRRAQTVAVADNPANRGQVLKIQHLVEVKVQR